MRKTSVMKIVKCQIGPITDENRKLVTNDREKADVLNHFFSSVFTDGKKDRVDSLNQISLKITLWMMESKIQKRLEKLNVKLPCPDCLCIAQLYILLSGIVPTDLDRLWHQFTKKDLDSLPGNYRPVSLAAIVCKVYKGIARDTMRKFVCDNR